MRLKTHRYIAETAIMLVEEITGMKFNHRLVKMGACAPDIALNRRIKLHNPELAVTEYDKLLGKFDNRIRSNSFLSYILGVYSHYVADSFCFAHNFYVIDLKKHVQYEMYMQEERLATGIPIDLVDMVLDRVEKLEGSTALEYIENENQAYSRLMYGRDDWENMVDIDMTYAIINSAVLMLQFVYEMQVQPILAPAV